MKLWRRLCGPIRLVMPAALARHRTTGGGVPCHPLAVVSEEDGALDPLAHGEVDGSSGARCERDRHGLAALAMHDEGAVTTFQTQLVDVRPEGF